MNQTIVLNNLAHPPKYLDMMMLMNGQKPDSQAIANFYSVKVLHKYPPLIRHHQEQLSCDGTQHQHPTQSRQGQQEEIEELANILTTTGSRGRGKSDTLIFKTYCTIMVDSLP
mmetsp:Transcript_16235/g.27043  ORF Transcript_16235/g.27043 Transcript_16235/m.27043 type:complete len:113 (+) Transcript_16235:429-767(+)